MPITIITVNHDAHRFIELCVKAVHMHTKIPYQHMIIDNGSNPATIQMLTEFHNKGWVRLIRRNMPKMAASHAASLNWILFTPPSDLVCLLDSDAYPIRNDWISYLIETMNTNHADAVGFAHFRDESLLHPSCMLFKYAAYQTSGKPSFAIKKSDKFWDTAMIMCDSLRRHGFKLMPISKEKLSEYVKHRWMATRFENARGNMIDDIPKEVYRKETEEWFRHPSAIEALRTQK